ncbi:hypothetical protein [Pseudooceanicola sp. MF1-13]|uniref:hypothetical protein n=1 Tax=Pseudooceanicola sp. MF1-13 TaxID=3379095 RepID=UPI003891FBAD
MMFVDLDEIALVDPSQADKGSLLIGDAFYSRSPMFLFSFENEILGFELAAPEGGDGGFRPDKIGRGSRRYLLAKKFMLEVDVSDASRVSPTRADILPGQVVLSEAGPCFAVRTRNHSTMFVSAAGELAFDIDDSRVVGFSRWRLTIPGVGDERHVIYEAGSPDA